MRMKQGMHRFCLAMTVAAAALSLFTPGCQLGDESARNKKLVQKTEEFWPLEKGNQWVYSLSGGPAGMPAKEWVMTVSDVKSGTWSKFATVSSSNKGELGRRSDVEMAVTPYGIYEVRHANMSKLPGDPVEKKFVTEMPALGTEPPYIYKRDPKKGDEWSFEFALLNDAQPQPGQIAQPGQQQAMGQVTGYRGKGKGKVLAEEEVTVPAGKFSTVKISFQTVAANGSVSDERIFWFARGVGPVKLQSRGVSFNLKSAKVEGKGAIGK